jgi:Uncharacterised protein family (UPF0175)
MNLTVLPDELAGIPSANGDLSRRVLEGFAIAEYKSERISKAQLRRLLGFDTRYELDDFLKTRQVWAKVTIDDMRRDLQDLDKVEKGTCGELRRNVVL